MTGTNQANRPIPIMAALGLCTLLAAGCDDFCADECEWGSYRCHDNHVEMCMSGAYDAQCESSPTVWQGLDACTGQVCTTQGCPREQDACCVAP